MADQLMPVARDQQTGKFVMDGEPAEAWKIVPVAMREDEKLAIKEHSKQQGLSVSAWCRQALLDAVQKAN